MPVAIGFESGGGRIGATRFAFFASFRFDWPLASGSAMPRSYSAGRPFGGRVCVGFAIDSSLTASPSNCKILAVSPSCDARRGAPGRESLGVVQVRSADTCCSSSES